MRNICPNCKTVLDSTAKFCMQCGTQVSQAADEQTGFLNYDEQTSLLTTEDQETSLLTEETGELRPEDRPDYFPQQPNSKKNIAYILNEKQFYDQCVSKKVKGWATAIGVIALISGTVSVPFLFLGNLLSIIDIAFYLTMGVLILVTRKWGLPLAVTIYSGLFSVISLATSGTMNGIIALVVGIFATINLKKANDAYRLYRQSGVLPQKPVE